MPACAKRSATGRSTRLSGSPLRAQTLVEAPLPWTLDFRPSTLLLSATRCDTFPGMKTLGTIFAVLLVIVALLVAGLQIFLTKGLTTALNQGVFPAVKAMYGLEMGIRNASVNLFKGSAELEGFTVRNLKGYEEPYLLTFDRCLLEIELLSLIRRDPVVIKTAEASGATLVIERNRDQLFNVKELADALKPVESAPAAPPSKPPVDPKAPAPAPDAPPPAEPAAEPAKPVPVHIRRIAVDTLVRYVDSRRKERYDLSLRLTGSDLFTVPAPGQPNSLLVLRGSLADDKNAFATDLNAILQPLTDPQKPSFNATGSILDIRAGFLRELLKKNEMESSSFSIEPSITCQNGHLQGSRIDLILKNLKIYGTEIGDTTLKLPLYGTLQKPALDITGALQSLFSKEALKIGKTLGLRELKKGISKELGVDGSASPQEMLLQGLTNQVKEVSESPALQELIQQVLPGAQPTNNVATNRPLGETVGSVLAEQLGKNVKELEGNEAVKETLKSLGTSLFGK
jgi:hypothetical protein